MSEHCCLHHTCACLLTACKSAVWFAQLFCLLQVNNQPPLLGQMALACQVMANTTAAGGSALEALSAAHTYFNSDGYSDWCYSWGFDPKALLVPGSGSCGYNSYSYQCCTQGTAYNSLLPAQGWEGVLNPEELSVSLKTLHAECR